RKQLERCLQWIKQCGRPHSQLNVSKINKHAYVCSKHFVNGKPTPEYPNPVVAVQVLNHTREQLGASRKPPKHRLGLAELNASSSNSCTDYAEETQHHVDDCESPEQPPLPGCQLEREPEEGQRSMSDKEIVRQCRIIPLLETLIDNGYLQRGDGIMADKSFLIEDKT
ncbi:hypothetical protein CHARACLAT_008913, partial [Characodon lateralis]|nr:hypothetical protein [Characodon lateralis]